MRFIKASHQHPIDLDRFKGPGSITVKNDWTTRAAKVRVNPLLEATMYLRIVLLLQVLWRVPFISPGED